MSRGILFLMCYRSIHCGLPNDVIHALFLAVQFSCIHSTLPLINVVVDICAVGYSFEVHNAIANPLPEEYRHTSCAFLTPFNMHSPAFASPFTGTALRQSRSSRSFVTPRCEMGDSIAPKISLKDTKFDGTSSVTVQWDAIPPNTSDAISIASNMALAVSLRSKTNRPSLPGVTGAPPSGVSPADFYFPKDSRNKAPVISFEHNESISVSYDTIDAKAGGVSANSVESIAFWKQGATKSYGAPDVSSDVPETLETSLYEKYFPSNIRNLAPFIRMKAPAGDWDNSAYIEYGTEFVGFNPELSLGLVLPEGEDTKDGPAPAAVSVVEKYYGEGKLHMAPEIDIVPDVKVAFRMSEVQEPVAKAAEILSTTN